MLFGRFHLGLSGRALVVLDLSDYWHRRPRIAVLGDWRSNAAGHGENYPLNHEVLHHLTRLSPR